MTVVQRYMDLSKFLYLVTEQALFLPKISAFEDQLEGGLSWEDYFRNSNDAPILDLALNGMWPPAEESAAERLARIARCDQLKKEIKLREFETPWGFYKCEDLPKVLENIREWMYVSCWHQSPYECIGMWKLYGGGGNSVCIFTSKEQIEEQLLNPSENIGFHLRSVSYKSYLERGENSDLWEPYFSKIPSFSFEKEIRLVGFEKEKDLTIDKNSEPGLKINIPDLKKFINKIVISPYADPWFLNLIKDLTCRLGMNFEILKSELQDKPVKDIYAAMHYSQMAER